VKGRQNPEGELGSFYLRCRESRKRTWESVDEDFAGCVVNSKIAGIASLLACQLGYRDKRGRVCEQELRRHKKRFAN
jgi:hypothetical protein